MNIQKSDSIVIKASWLGQLDYCEYKWYLENVEGVEIPRTKAMIRGAEIHKQKEEDFKEVAIPATMEDFLKSTKYTITKELTLWKEFEDFVLVGKIDELGIDTNNVYVIDDKPNAYPWPGIKMQLWAYGLLFESNFSNVGKKIRCILRDRDTEVEVWDESFLDFHKNKVVGALFRIKDLFFKKATPKTSDRVRKCRSCVLHQQNRCQYSLA